MTSKIKISGLFLLLIAVGSCHNADQDVLNNSPSARVAVNQQPADRKPNVDESVKGDYEVRAGMLYFKDLETYLTLRDKLNKMQTDEQIAFAKNLGFTSALKRYSEILIDLDKIRDKQQYDKALTDNKITLSLQDEEIRPVFNPVHAALMNQENMVSIGKVIHCFMADATVMVIDGDVIKARQATQSLTSTDENIVVFGNGNNRKSSIGGRRAASCSRFDQTRENTDHNRRVRVTSGLGTDSFLKSTPPGYGNYYYIQVYSLIEGTAFKKNFWGNWVPYSTGNTMYASYSVDISWFSLLYNAPTSTSFGRNYVFSNDSHVIHDKVVFETADWVPQNLAYLFDASRYTPVYHEGDPSLGYYSSGGVPSGTPLTCP